MKKETLQQIWSDERYIQARMIQERLENGMPPSEVVRIDREIKQIEAEGRYAA